jgi:Ni/Fe-hydrogenase subunit HybB-like protein
MIRADRYTRAYLAGIALPTIVVCVAGLVIFGLFDRFDHSLQHALILPLATNPLLWGMWNVVWAMLGPPGAHSSVGTASSCQSFLSASVC